MTIKTEILFDGEINHLSLNYDNTEGLLIIECLPTEMHPSAIHEYPNILQVILNCSTVFTTTRELSISVFNNIRVYAKLTKNTMLCKGRIDQIWFTLKITERLPNS